MTESVKAYAKINLHLDISGIREDGYHSVETVMQTVSLCDTVRVTLKGDGNFSCQCDVDGVPTDESNIAVKAAMLFFKVIDSKNGAHIEIDKRIPMSAGLAGGSADAAATLIALNRLCGAPLSIDQLCEIGSRLGADVPFCIVCGCAYTDGRGDVIHSFPAIPADTVFLVACGGEGVSTPWAYRLMDSVYNDFKDYSTRGIEMLRRSLDSSEPSSFSKHLFNIFEAPVLRERPVAREIKKLMLNMGAEEAMMSGSGPSVFGIFADENAAKDAGEKINKMGYFSAVCSPIKREA